MAVFSLCHGIHGLFLICWVLALARLAVQQCNISSLLMLMARYWHSSASFMLAPDALDFTLVGFVRLLLKSLDNLSS